MVCGPIQPKPLMAPRHQDRRHRNKENEMNTKTVLATLALVGMLAARPSTANAAIIRGAGSATPILCVNVKGDVSTNGTPVQAYFCSGNFNDQWEYVNGQFIGLGSNASAAKCLDVVGDGTAPGTPIDLFTCNGSGGQEWRLGGLPDNYNIVNTPTGLCLDSKGGEGVQLTIETCDESVSQNWKIN
jgi:hypothetical protein